MIRTTIVLLLSYLLGVGLAQAAEPVAPRIVKVGLLLPLSGTDAALGQAMLDGATLALFEKFDRLDNKERNTQLQLIPRDTANGAADAAKQAIEAGAQMLLGPLYAEDTDKAAEVARTKNIPLLSFSNSEKVAGRGVYLLGLSPNEQTARIAEFLYSHRFTRIAALLPGDPYGADIAKMLNAVAHNTRAPEPFIALYPNGQEEAAVEDLGRKIAAMASEERPQALMIGEGGKPLYTISSALIKNKIDPTKIRLVGSSQWDDALTARIPTVQTGWFAGQNFAGRQAFEVRYLAKFGKAAPRLAALAYDATAFAYVLALKNPADFTPATLTASSGYEAPNGGLFRLLPDGTNQHGLVVIEVGKKGFQIIDPAPNHF